MAGLIMPQSLTNRYYVNQPYRRRLVLHEPMLMSSVLSHLQAKWLTEAGHSCVSFELPNYGTASEAKAKPYGYSSAEIVQLIRHTVLEAGKGVRLVFSQA
jgi:hypothetical protein